MPCSRESRLPVGSSHSSSDGSLDQRTRDGDPLALAAGELAWVGADAGGRGRPGRAPSRAAAQRAVAGAPVVQLGEHHVLLDGAVRQQVEALEHEADPAAAHRGTLSVRQRVVSIPSSR